jgi:Radical SAM superfamily/4Fe-4S single cluster domain
MSPITTPAVRGPNMRLLSTVEKLVGGVSRTFRWPLWRGMAPPPLFAFVLLTYRCNLQCGFCYQGECDNEHADVYFSQAALDHLLAYLPRRTFVSFSGGEPLCHPEAMDFIAQAARTRGVSLVTNGLLITHEIARKIAELGGDRWWRHGLNVVGISVTESPAAPDDFDAAVAGKRAVLESLREEKLRRGRGLPLVDVKVVIRPENVAVLGRFLGFLRDGLADVVTFQLQNNLTYPPYLDGRNNATPALTPPEAFPPTIAPVELRAALEEILSSPERRAGRVRFYPELRRDEVVRYFDGQPLAAPYSCVFPWTGLMVSPFGNAFQCRNPRSEPLLGRNLSEVWNSKNFRSFRRLAATSQVGHTCAGCCFLKER